ncbi:hypothetical protein CRV24_006373 [Beauveria bassiana]|nr:hypothetical protein CRV24_006373 [Beauveria bassiana]KAH8715464.1 hypothetical protein HC256_004283 [Beauveria bassiana]
MSLRPADTHTGSAGNAPRAIQSTPARASCIRVEAIEKFEEADRADHSLFLRLVHDQLAIYREQRNDAAIDELHYPSKPLWVSLVLLVNFSYLAG